MTGLPFETINARGLDPADVARSFVLNTHFERLARPAHSIVVGPRGSGKTTLLKMLHPRALEHWASKDAPAFRKSIDYTGVFIPTDRAWSAQILALGQERLSPEESRILGVAAFTTHVLKAWVEAVHHRAQPAEGVANPVRRLGLNRDVQAHLATRLAASWGLTTEIPSLLAVRTALSNRLDLVAETCGVLTAMAPVDRAREIAVRPFLHRNFITSLISGLDSLEEILDAPSGKWALLFDELELAPQWIRETLFGALRSVDSRLLFKLSLCPYGEKAGFSIYSAMQGHDYEAIRLWYPNKEEGYDFCNELLKSVLLRRGIDPKKADSILGRSAFDALPSIDDGPRNTPEGHKLRKTFAELAAKDSSFQHFLTRNDIAIEGLQHFSGAERAEKVRKFGAVAIIRNTFLSNEPNRLRSRKNPNLYYGRNILFAVTEGNPRLLLGLLGNLIEQPVDYVSPSKQSTALAAAQSRFRAFLKTIPTTAPRPNERDPGVLRLIDHIGEYFESHVIGPAFDPEPAGSFTVDSNVPPELIESLGKALNAGALVYVPDPGSELVMTSLAGKRFRLSYLLAQHYRLPLILMRPVSLRTILNARSNSVGRGRQYAFFSPDN